MGREKKKRRKKSALAAKVIDLTLDTIAATTAGLITTAILKWFG